VNVRLVRHGVLTDMVTNAAVMDVVEDDPLGLGEVPVREWAINVIDQSWHVGSTDDASADGTAVADVHG
jgi:hypothetical protein